MNIFVTSPCPVESAKYLDNKRVIKMILESVQLLNNTTILLFNETMGYKLTHKNHPCSIWVRSDPRNYFWLLRHLKALCIEYKERYHKDHACSKYIPFFEKFVSDTSEPKNFVNCTTNHKHIENVFEAYKASLSEKWKNDKRKPSWAKNEFY